MNPLQRHMALTAVRGKLFEGLFGGKPVKVYPAHELRNGADDPFLIDVLVYEFEMEGQTYIIQAAVTNGLSDHRMPEGDDPDSPRRRELIQYFYHCTPGHAKRLRDMAWLPLHDGFHLDSHHTIRWEFPAVEGSPWKNALFLEPLLRPHREFTAEVDGDPMSLLWYVPVSDAEREFILGHGTNEFLDRMRVADLPWVFDEETREPVV